MEDDEKVLVAGRFKFPLLERLDRIEAQNKEILALLQKKKRVVKPRGSSDGFGPAFTKVWDIYPKRAGSNPKQKAFAAYNKRISEQPSSSVQWDMVQGTARYAKFCDATGKTGTEYVMQAATFFGPDKHYENDWTIPKPKNGQPEVFSQSHSREGNSVNIADLDPVDPYADLK